MGIWVCPRASLNNTEKDKFFTIQGLELRSLGHPAHSQSPYQLRYPCSPLTYWENKINCRREITDAIIACNIRWEVVLGFIVLSDMAEITCISSKQRVNVLAMAERDFIRSLPNLKTENIVNVLATRYIQRTRHMQI
jgi:hypothetical protein